MRPTQWRTSTHLIVGVGVLAIVAAVVAAAALLTASGRSTGGAQVPPPPPAVTAKPGVVPVADTAAMPTNSALAAALAPVVADPNLGKLGGRVTDAMTGEELWQQFDDVLLQPASTNKTLTSAAALLGAGPRRAGHHPRGRRHAARDHRAGRWRRPDAVGGGTRTGHLVPRRGADQRSRRPGTPQRRDADRHPGEHLAVQRPDLRARLGPGRHRRRRHRTDRIGHARRRTDPAGNRRVPTIGDAGSRRGTRAGRRAGRRPAAGHRHRPCRQLRRATIGRGPVGPADRPAQRDDERLRQRDGRVHRPRGRRIHAAAAELQPAPSTR